MGGISEASVIGEGDSTEEAKFSARVDSGAGLDAEVGADGKSMFSYCFRSLT